MARRSLFCCALLPPESIAGGVNAEYLSLDIPVGHRWVGLTANQARVGRGSSNDNPRYRDGLAREDLVSQ